MKQRYVYTCEEIQSGTAVRSQGGGYKGTRLYTIKGACQNLVNATNAESIRFGLDKQYELVTYELIRVNAV